LVFWLPFFRLFATLVSIFLFLLALSAEPSGTGFKGFFHLLF